MIPAKVKETEAEEATPEEASPDTEKEGEKSEDTEKESKKEKPLRSTGKQLKEQSEKSTQHWNLCTQEQVLMMDTLPSHSWESRLTKLMSL